MSVRSSQNTNNRYNDHLRFNRTFQENQDSLLGRSSFQDKILNFQKSRQPKFIRSINESPMKSQLLDQSSFCFGSPKSTYKQSWSKFVHTLHPQCSLGIKRKPLVAYDQNHSRNKLPIVFTKDKSKQKSRKTFQNFSMITNKAQLKRIFQSVYHKNYKHPKILKMQRMNSRSVDI